MESKSTYLTVAALVATGVIAYAVYFDYKRRNDAEFRRKLKKEKKRVNKTAALSQEAESAASTVTPDMLKEAVEAVRSEPAPALAQRETYFMTQVGMGEQLAMQGPNFHLPAAIAFYRALRMYPAPQELINIYENTVPKDVYKLIIQMTNLDVTARIQGFFDVFPPKSMNVSIEKRELPNTNDSRNVIVASRDFAAGETIYKEIPIVAALDQDLQAAGSHCTHCFRTLVPGASFLDDELSSVIPTAYCSKACMNASKARSQGLLFTMASPLPEELQVGPMPDLGLGDRKAAQVDFYEYVKKQKRNGPLLAARFIARQVVHETNRMAATSGKKASDDDEMAPDYPTAESEDYQLADHMERWRFMESAPPAEELPLINSLLKTILPGLEQFTTAERYNMMASKIAYNSFGVCFDGGRDERPMAADARPEDLEKTRTPYGTDRQVGSAVYIVSGYLTHSCAPSARVSYESGTTELALVAERDIKKGDILSVAYVDVKKHDDESVAECKRRRRVELVRGWKFACGCERCEEEAVQIAAEAPAPVPEAVEAANADADAIAQADESTQSAPAAPAVALEVEAEPETVGDGSRVDTVLDKFEANPPAPIVLGMPNITADVE